MENRARYVLVGAFVLACLLGGFGFVYWIVNIGGLGARAVYAVRFEEPVSGITPGASVLFNGIRVGTVTAVKLDAKTPKQVTLLLAVAPDTPVRADTLVGLTFQGLTGSPAVALTGGAPDAAPLDRAAQGPPVLIAAPGAGDGVTDAARGTLKRLDSVVAQNAEPINTAIVGIATFADMLGRNSKRVEGLLGGLENLTGAGKKETPDVYDLSAANDFAGLGQISTSIAIGGVNALLVFDSQKIQTLTARRTYAPLPDAQWADTLPKLVQAKLVQSFENAHQLGNVSRPLEQVTPEYRLEVSIRSFATGPDGKAQVELAVRLVSDKGAVRAAQVFTAGAGATGGAPGDIVAALDRAFREAASDIVHWTVTAAMSDETPQNAKKPL